MMTVKILRWISYHGFKMPWSLTLFLLLLLKTYFVTYFDTFPRTSKTFHSFIIVHSQIVVNNVWADIMYSTYLYFSDLRSTTTNANKHPRQTRPNLAPLKMPEKRKTPSPTIDKVDTPPSTGNSTPATATPGSAGSATTSPQWSFPGGSHMSNPGSPSPLTVT